MTASRVPGRFALTVGSGVIAAATWLALSELGVNELIGADRLDWLWLSGALGLVVGALGWFRPLVILGASTVAALLLVGVAPPFGQLARRYIRNDPWPANRPDAVIVLSGAVSSDGRLSPPAVDRLLTGIGLADSVGDRRVIVSRVWVDPGEPEAKSSDHDQRAIVAAAGRQLELIQLDSVGSTRQEAVAARTLFDQRGWRAAVVVTSPVHTRRACAAFEAAGLIVTCRASPDREVAVYSARSPGDRIRSFGLWLYETLGWWSYRWRGWVRPVSP